MKKIILVLIFIFICLTTNKVKSTNKKALNLNTNICLVNKTYTLDKNYEPNDLVLMNECKTSKEIFIKKEVYENYLKLDNYLKSKNIYFICYSGYRSYLYQKYIYQDPIYQAKPGKSEHQTGLALDITLLDVGLIEALATYNEYKYLINNMHKFGFILRYPKEKEDITKYPFEPWHIRYVGKKVATEIKKNNWCLEEYYITKGLM